MPAPETPGELLEIIARWQRAHEGRPASKQQTAMTTLYSAIRDILPVHEGRYRTAQVSATRTALEDAFPDLQEQVYTANRAASEG